MFGVDFAPKKIRNVFELRVYKLGSKQIVWLRERGRWKMRERKRTI